MQRALNGERFASVDLLMQRADGSRMPVSASGAPIPDVRGGEPRAVLVFEDMTAVKELERLRAEWSSIVAHDLRQPLNVIALQAGTAQRSLRRAPGGLPEEAIQAMDAIRRQVSRLNRMIDDLLDLSALEARRLALSRRPTDLAEVARSSLELVRADGGEAHSIELHVGGPLPVVDVDPDRIAQVLENLLSNAVKYGSPGAPIVVALGTSPGQVHVTVTNEGPGLAPQDLPGLFRRFARAEDARRGTVKGTGLGLYIARELVTAHGGEITVASVPGGKTTFRFTIPIGAPPAGRPAA
jgi:signal transduction histidine kinase